MRKLRLLENLLCATVVVGIGAWLRRPRFEFAAVQIRNSFSPSFSEVEIAEAAVFHSLVGREVLQTIDSILVIWSCLFFARCLVHGSLDIV